MLVSPVARTSYTLAASKRDITLEPRGKERTGSSLLLILHARPKATMYLSPARTLKSRIRCSTSAEYGGSPLSRSYSFSMYSCNCSIVAGVSIPSISMEFQKTSCSFSFMGKRVVIKSSRLIFVHPVPGDFLL